MDISKAEHALDELWNPQKRYGLRAALNHNSFKRLGSVLGNSWHPAGEVEGYDEDTELDGTAAFELFDPSSLRSAIRSVWNYWPDARKFMVLEGHERHSGDLPEDGAVLMRSPRVIMRMVIRP